MSTTKKILLVVLLLAIVAMIWIFWGSIFSAVLIYCLVMALPVCLYNRFVNVDRESDFTDEDSF